MAHVDAMTIESWVSLKYPVQHLGVAKGNLHRWREHRDLPTYNFGRPWKFELSEVHEWVCTWGAGNARNQKSGTYPEFCGRGIS
jgi:hypothetical protein